MTITDDDYRDWDAAYVLGMLSPDDRRAYERHLGTCSACSSAVAELAGLPGILGALTAEEAVELTTVTDAASLHDSAHEPGLVQRLAATSVRRRRRTRFALGGGSVLVAAVLAVGAFFVGSSIATPAPPAAIPMTAIGGNAVAADLTVTSKKWGTRLDWNCSYGSHGSAGPGGAADMDYDLVVTEKDGTEVVVASWSAYGEAAKNLSASTRVATGDIRSVDIRLEGSTTPLAQAKL
jgi:Putative zinc-finger